MTTNHTNGPWESVREGDDPGFLVRGVHGDQPRIALVKALTGSNKRTRILPAEANANLIAAAPALLAACERTLVYLGELELDADIRSQLRAAIAKARGEESQAKGVER